MLEQEIFLNQLAQGVRNVDEGQNWFAALSMEEQRGVLTALANMAVQAGALKSDAVKAIESAQMKPTYTPCVLLQRDNLAVQLAKIVNLEGDEQRKSFKLLLALFRIADARRRTVQCVQGCNHWWHRDLSDPVVIDNILTTERSLVE